LSQGPVARCGATRWLGLVSGTNAIPETPLGAFSPGRGPGHAWMAATLDGVAAGTGAVHEAGFMLPRSLSEEFAAEKRRCRR
jgi:hypothetical protein